MARLVAPLTFPLGGDFTTPPDVELLTPGEGATNVAADTALVLSYIDNADTTTDLSTIEITVDSVIAWQSGAPANGWAGSLETVSPLVHNIFLSGPNGFAYGETAVVETSLTYEDPFGPQSIAFTFTFTVVENPACWAGTLSAFEKLLLVPQPNYAVEQLRQRFLYSVTSTHDSTKSARVVAQMAFETEIQAILAKLIDLSPDVLASNVCERRRYIDVDVDMKTFGFLVNPAISAMSTLLPDPYIGLLRKHAFLPYAKYRMSALAALLCAAAALG